MNLDGDDDHKAGGLSICDVQCHAHNDPRQTSKLLEACVRDYLAVIPRMRRRWTPENAAYHCRMTNAFFFTGKSRASGCNYSVSIVSGTVQQLLLLKPLAQLG